MDNFPDGFHSSDDPANRPVVCESCDRRIGDHADRHELPSGGVLCKRCKREEEQEDDDDWVGDAR